jgi:N6-adenosine-specific RNA methylase IME4
MNLPPGPFQLIYVDPPWSYRDKAAAGKRGASFKYPTQSVTDLFHIPVWDIAAEDCLLAMWWVPPQPQEALDLAKVWGFKIKTMKGFTWHKTTLNGKSHFGMGNWTRANTEDCLIAVRGKPKRVSASVRQFVEAPIREHSQKPDEVRDRLVQLMGDVPRIELFARTTAPGWSVWGNEVEKFSPVLSRPE